MKPNTLHQRSSNCGVKKLQVDADERPLTVQVQSDPHVQRQGAFGRLLSVFRRSSVQQLGFPNIGNTCFMNATLQCLLSLPCFSTPIIDQQVSWTDTSISQMLRCLAELQQARLSSSGTSMQKRHLLRAVKRCLSTRCPDFGYYAQQDAHEFLMLCLLQLKEEGEALRASSLPYICPVANFEFQLRSVRTCTSCGLQRSRVEDFNHLSINLSSTLTHSLHSYFQQTELELSCQCGKGRQACEVQEFSTLPRVLILHVKRFSMLGDGKKLKDVMDIPAQLDLSHFPGVASLGQSGGSACSQSFGHLGTEKLEANPLDLSSFRPGHYISDAADGAGGDWLSFDDSKVSQQSEAAVLKCRATTAYLLFYVHR
ncbi:ubiquitin carboxyl-terminal hydrolase 37-like [Salminus brasiliensis]|uniref:ubiquitin carboxyl-terminal hydrolase 37-like n=1 Tax=Salminus brasiliensis TaxID=930266 RepID=UPI003B8322D9